MLKLIPILLGLVTGHHNAPLQFLVGPAPNGAVRVVTDNTLDLQTGCDGKRCPSVVIFIGNDRGTIDLYNCTVGQLYYFINKSLSDLGIVVQQRGGLYGAKPLAQYAIGNCFCYPRGPEEADRERRLSEVYGNGDTNTPPPPTSDTMAGVLLCG
jgi:hypothetical protein